ncbi:unnamed protein product [Ectocarpus sp. CCAP 1310/34]|nr:unnamed protein product [Ectocarpus sp. CCAP 1310/34]
MAGRFEYQPPPPPSPSASGGSTSESSDENSSDHSDHDDDVNIPSRPQPRPTSGDGVDRPNSSGGERSWSVLSASEAQTTARPTPGAVTAAAPAPETGEAAAMSANPPASPLVSLPSPSRKRGRAPSRPSSGGAVAQPRPQPPSPPAPAGDTQPAEEAIAHGHKSSPARAFGHHSSIASAGLEATDSAPAARGGVQDKIPRQASCSPRRISDRTPVVPRTSAPAGEEANLPELAEPTPQQPTAPRIFPPNQTQVRGSELAGEADAVDSGKPSSSTPQTSAGGQAAAATEASTASYLPSLLALPRATSSQPRQRGRQRPKPAPQPSAAELEAPPETNTQAAAERVPPPDETGRPRKTPLPPAAADQAATPDLRKRGRQKKTPLEPAPSGEKTTPDLPRKRGRPRKTPLEPAASDETTSPDLPRKRERPRKTPLEPAASDEATTPDLPCKRGRSRKTPLEPAVADKATTPDQQRATSSNSAPPSPVGAPTPRQVAAAVGAAATVTASPQPQPPASLQTAGNIVRQAASPTRQRRSPRIEDAASLGRPEIAPTSEGTTPAAAAARRQQRTEAIPERSLPIRKRNRPTNTTPPSAPALATAGAPRQTANEEEGDDGSSSSSSDSSGDSSWTSGVSGIKAKRGSTNTNTTAKLATDSTRSTPTEKSRPGVLRGLPPCRPDQQRLPAEPREEVDIPAGGNADGSAETGSRSGKMRRKAQRSAGQRQQQQQQQSPEANPPPANHAQDGAGADIGRHVDDGGSAGDCGENFGSGGSGGSVDGGSCNEMNEGGFHVAREEEGRVASSEQQVDGSVKAGGPGKTKRSAVGSGGLQSQSRRMARELADPPAGNERHRGIPRSTRGGGGGTSDGSKDETEGPTTTRDEDLALVREMHQEREGLLAVRTRLRREVVTLQDEEDELRLVLGLPPARSELVLATPPPLPPPVEPSAAVAPAEKKRRPNPQWRTTPPAQGEPSVATGTSFCSSSSPAAANGPSVSPQRPSPSVAIGASSSSPATASSAGASPPHASPSVTTPSSSPAAAFSAGVAPPSVSPPRTERSPVAAASSRSSSIAAASSPQALASTPGNDDTPMGSPLSLLVPGSPVGSFDPASGENDDIEKLLLGLDSMTGDDDNDDDDDIVAPAGGLGGLRYRGAGPAPLPPPPSSGGAPIGARQQPFARQRTAGSGPQLSGRRGSGGLNQPESVAGRGTAVGNGVRGQQQPRRGEQLLSSGRGGVASGGKGRGRGARRAPNYLDLNASFLRRPAGRGVASARGGRLGSGSRGGRGGGGRGPPVVSSGRGGRRNGPVRVGGGSAAARPGDGGLGSGASHGGRVGGRGHLVRGATGPTGGPHAREVRDKELVGVAQHSEEQTSTGGARVTTVSPGDARLPDGSGRLPGL